MDSWGSHLSKEALDEYCAQFKRPVIYGPPTPLPRGTEALPGLEAFRARQERDLNEVLNDRQFQDKRWDGRTFSWKPFPLKPRDASPITTRLLVGEPKPVSAWEPVREAIAKANEKRGEEELREAAKDFSEAMDRHIENARLSEGRPKEESTTMDYDGYPENFQYAVERTIEDEGGFSDHPSDRGGRTKYGITSRTWTEWLATQPEGWYGDVSTITKSQAARVYYDKYWKKNSLDEIEDKFVAAEIFDTSVNCGPGTAAKIAQTAVNMLSNGDVLVVDGILGPHTFSTLNSLSKRYRLSLVVALNLVQGMRYTTLLKREPERYGHFIKGWMKRLVPPVELLA